MKVTTNFGTVKIVMLKGEKGDKFQFEDYTPEELESLRGEKGDAFTYEDFTQAQLEDLRSEVASAYYRKVDATYYTIGDNTETIAIPIESYNDSDMLFVDVEGLALTEGVDYTIEGSNIVLTTPITHNYTAVNFRALRAFAITTEDYNSLIGDLTSDLDSYVDEWLTEHPEATTTVQDGSVTNAKLVQSGGILSEVIDIRTGADGITYDTAGDAVRENMNILSDNMEKSIDRLVIVVNPLWEIGSISASTGQPTSSGNTRIRTKDFISTDDVTNVSIDHVSATMHSWRLYTHYYDENYVWQSSATTNSTVIEQTINSNYAYFKFVLIDNTGGSWSNPISIDDANSVITAWRKSEKTAEIEDAITDLESYMETTKTVIGDSLPDYWISYLNGVGGNAGKALDVTNQIVNAANHGDSFAFVTDVHLDNNEKHSPAIIRNLLAKTPLDMVIYGGDTFSFYNSRESPIRYLKSWAYMMNGTDMFVVRGNHDSNENGTPTGDPHPISAGEFYSLLMKPIERRTNTEGKTYYAYDNESQKIRYIFLDTGAPDSAYIDTVQLEWMQEKIMELDSGWSVLVICHQFFTGVLVSSGITELPYDTNGTLIKAALDGIYDLADAIIVGVVCGHCHRDYSDVSSKGYPIISTTCDAGGSSASNWDLNYPTRTTGTTSEQAIDVYTIDTENRTITVMRIGAGDTAANRSFSY